MTVLWPPSYATEAGLATRNGSRSAKWTHDELLITEL